MSDAVTISLIGAMTTVAVSGINLIVSLMSSKRGKRNESHLMDLKNQTNGIQIKLEDAAFARGVKSETDKK